MSDDGSNKAPSEDGASTNESSTTAQAIQSLLDDALIKKKQFDAFVVSSNNAIEEIISKAKSGLVEIDASKTAVETAKDVALSEIDQSKTAVTTAKGVVEAASAEIDKTKTSVATAKGAIEEIQKAASADLGSINQSKVDIDKLQAAAKAQAESLTAEHSTVSRKIEELQQQQAPLENILSELVGINAEAKADSESVTANIKTISDAKTAFETLNTQTQEQYDALLKRRVTLDAEIAEIGIAHESIKEIHKSLFDDTGEKKSVRSEIDGLRTQISTILEEVTTHRNSATRFFDEFKTNTDADKKELASKLESEFGELHATLEGKILALLPSAGAAGLATTYYDAKSRYAPTSVAGKPGATAFAEKRVWWKFSLHGKFGYNPASVVATISFYILFIIPILVIVWLFYNVLHGLPSGKLADLDYKILILRVLIALPLATISAFGFTSLRLYRRLYEEYNHKQRVMELYTSFRQEIADNGTDEQKKALLTIMLNTVADKSYLTIGAMENRDDEEILSKVNTAVSLLNNLTKIKGAA